MTDTRQPPQIYIAMLPRRRRRVEAVWGLVAIVSLTALATAGGWWLTHLKL